ncbi:hypothetical protein CL617_03140 [archaeon]|nr:hypothetical protein [archaeon]|tara:strand:+ start:32592 stop:35270 length:2679 start_codon:yes stop_codon:yes gene_type:complete
MNNKKSLLVTLFLIISLFVNLSAAHAEFSVTDTQNEAVVCPGSTALFTTTIQGTGDFTANLEGSASSFSTVVPPGFSLIAEGKTLFVYSTPSSRVQPGIYDLNLLISDKSTVKRSEFSLNVANCHQLSIASNTPSKELCGCSSERFSFTVENNGNFQETYDLSVAGSSSSYSTISESVITLASGTSKEIFIDVNAPCNTQGSFDVILNAQSRNSQVSASSSSNVEITKCFDYKALIDKNFVNFCERTEQIIPITIVNEAQTLNNYNLQVSGPAWANLERTSTQVNPLSQGIVNLILTPDYGVLGDFNINVNIEDSNGKVKVQNLVKATVNSCNSVQVDIPKDNDRICQGSKNTYDFTVKNTGQFEKTFQLIKNQEFISTDKSTLSLNAGEEETVSLTVNVEGNVNPNNYEIKITSTATDTDQITNSDSLNLEVISGNKCFDPEIKTSDVKLNQDSSLSHEIEIVNDGQFETTYNLGLSGTASSFIQLNPATVSIQPGKSETVYLYISPSIITPPGDYEATLSLRSTNTDTILKSETIEIEVVTLDEDQVLPRPSVTTTTDVKKDNQTSTGFFATLNRWFEDFFTPQNETTSDIVQDVITTTTTIETQDNDTETTTTLDSETTTTIESDTTTTIVTNIEIKDISEINKVTKKTRFKFNNESHFLSIESIKEDSVIVVIQSNVTAFKLFINEEKEVDIDNDGSNDVIIKLNKIKDGEPELEIATIGTSSKLGAFSLNLDFLTNNLKFILAGLAILIIIILLLVFRKQIYEFFEEEDQTNKEVKTKDDVEEEIKEIDDDFDDFEEYEDENVQELKIGRYIIGLIAIIILYFLFRRYSFLESVAPYRVFILGALILLLIIVLIVRYWNDIVEFFEEDDEPVSKKTKKKTTKKTKRK